MWRFTEDDVALARLALAIAGFRNTFLNFLLLHTFILKMLLLRVLRRRTGLLNWTFQQQKIFTTITDFFTDNLPTMICTTLYHHKFALKNLFGI